MASWWTSLTKVEQDMLVEELVGALRREVRTYVEDEQAARNEYARWFVREHFLAKDYEIWCDAGDTNSGGVYQYQRILQQQGFNVMGGTWETAQLSGYTWPPDHDYFVNITDLRSTDPSPANLPPTPSPRVSAAELVQWCREKFREYEALHNDDCTWRWLIAEATYHRVLNEALVRSYGVDVSAP